VRGKDGWGSIWAAYRYRARKKGFTWQLTREEFEAMLIEPCFYCGQPPTELNGNVVTVRGVQNYYSGVDRVNNDPIYSEGLCVPCCARCNMAKGELTQEEFLKHAKRIVKHAQAKWRAKKAP